MLAAHRAYRIFALDDESEIRATRASFVPKWAPLGGEYGGPSIRGHFAVRLDDRTAAAAEIPALLRLMEKTPPGSPSLGLVGEAIALAGTAEEREATLARLAPHAAREVHTAPVPQTYEGPLSRVIGLLEASLGRLDEADVRLESARARCRANRFRLWVARLSLERGRVVAALGRAGEARALFEEAIAVASDVGMKRVADLARTALGVHVALPAATSAPPPAASPSSPLRLVREGEVWRIERDDQIARVRDSRGIQLLAKLVAALGERVHALALAGDGDAALPESDAGEAIDRKAVVAYRARLSKIDDEIAAAEPRGDGRRVDALRHERELLVAEIARAIGLGGRLRKVGSATERARINVTRRLKDAVARIAEANAALGRHLEAEIRTGTYCSYGEKS
jgi:hypothetical protein